jgi:protein-tyrosine-phosphatase
MGFFSRRRKREAALTETTDTALGSFASPEGQPVVGQQVGGGQPEMNLQGLGAMDGLKMLSQLGPMIQQAMASGNVQISQGQPQVLDMRGSGLREEILGIMNQHGIDPDAGTADQNIDASAYGNMQQQILEALAKHGVNANPAAANPSDYAQMQREMMDVMASHGIDPATGLPKGNPPEEGK